jgi:hypothetical protein
MASSAQCSALGRRQKPTLKKCGLNEYNRRSAYRKKRYCDMNERIKELIEECTDRHFSECVGGFETFDKEKFAELIVRECIECADMVGKNNLASGYPNSTAHHVKQKIKEHFGVEE